jgi:hypothetical protein
VNSHSSNIKAGRQKVTLNFTVVRAASLANRDLGRQTQLCCYLGNGLGMSKTVRDGLVPLIEEHSTSEDCCAANGVPLPVHSLPFATRLGYHLLNQLLP